MRKLRLTQMDEYVLNNYFESNEGRDQREFFESGVMCTAILISAYRWFAENVAQFAAANYEQLAAQYSNN